MMQSEWRRESPVIAREIAVHARERSMSPAHFAIGGRCTEEQWGEYCGALECRLTAEDEALVDRLVSPGHPSTPGYNDRQYPIEGRVLRSG
jgi:hypothetical protein